MVKTNMGKKSTAAALRLGRSAGVPHLAFMTDEDRAPNPAEVCEHLPAGSIVICRDYDHVDRVGLAEELRAVTRDLNQFLLVAADPELARKVDADGLHLPEYMLKDPPSLAAFGLVSAACHSRRALVRAKHVGVDFAFVSPVFPTLSHLDGDALGIHRFARMVRGTPVPVVALGGVNRRTAALLKPFKLQGLAAIGAFVERSDYV